ncbi:MAG: hypothetical protein ACRD3W_26160 [Terriglobales bacterium]
MGTDTVMATITVMDTVMATITVMDMDTAIMDTASTTATGMVATVAGGVGGGTAMAKVPAGDGLQTATSGFATKEQMRGRGVGLGRRPFCCHGRSRAGPFFLP